jgi:hypothetical protein
MKFDSISRILLVAAVAAAFPLSASADGTKAPPAQHPRPNVRPGDQPERKVDGQRPPKPKPKDGKKDRRHRKKPPPRPHPGPKPTPPGN